MTGNAYTSQPRPTYHGVWYSNATGKSGDYGKHTQSQPLDRPEVGSTPPPPPPNCEEARVRVQHKSALFGGKTQDRGTNEASLQSLKRLLLTVRPNKGGTFPSQRHQWFRQVSKILHKSPVISDKANKLSYTFNLIRRMPVPNRRQFCGVTR